MSESEIPTLQVDGFDGWDDMTIEDDRSSLLATIVIHGTKFHLEAIEVMKRYASPHESGVLIGYEAVDIGRQPIVDRIQAVDNDGAMQLTMIGGKSYLVAATPYHGES